VEIGSGPSNGHWRAESPITLRIFPSNFLLDEIGSAPSRAGWGLDYLSFFCCHFPSVLTAFDIGHMTAAVAVAVDVDVAVAVVRWTMMM